MDVKKQRKIGSGGEQNLRYKIKMYQEQKKIISAIYLQRQVMRDNSTINSDME